MQVMRTLPLSKANGPGVNTVFWFQGCTHRCKGCINPESWSKDGGTHRTPYELLKSVDPAATGITLTGGEPFQQDLCELFQLVCGARARKLSVTIFTGYTFEEINAKPLMLECLSNCTTAIVGRYEQDKPCYEPLRASTNQVVLGDCGEVVDAEMFYDMDTGRIVSTGVHVKMRKGVAR